MTHTPDPEDKREEREEETEEGQRSEVTRMDDSETPVAPEDATAGYPDSESGAPDEGAAGPEASQPENRRDRQV